MLETYTVANVHFFKLNSSLSPRNVNLTAENSEIGAQNNECQVMCRYLMHIESSVNVCMKNKLDLINQIACVT